MYYLLGGCLCVSAIFLVATTTSLLTLLSRPLQKRLSARCDPTVTAWALFAVRLMPALLAALVTSALVLPAFILLEPRSTQERVGLPLALLTVMGLLMLGTALLRTVQSSVATSRIERRWRSRSRALQLDGVPIPSFRVDDPGASLSVLGILRPKLFVSGQVMSSLTAAELAAAVSHEMAHIRSGDNLKQLLMRIMQPPVPLGRLFASLDAGWLLSAEMAADGAALASGSSAVDLASALVKVARLATPRLRDGVTASYLVPVATPSALSARIRYLMEVMRHDAPVRQGLGRIRRSAWIAMAVCAGFLFYCFSHPAVLTLTHEVMEAVVR